MFESVPDDVLTHGVMQFLAVHDFYQTASVCRRFLQLSHHQSLVQRQVSLKLWSCMREVDTVCNWELSIRDALWAVGENFTTAHFTHVSSPCCNDHWVYQDGIPSSNPLRRLLRSGAGDVPCGLCTKAILFDKHAAIVLITWLSRLDACLDQAPRPVTTYGYDMTISCLATFCVEATLRHPHGFRQGDISHGQMTLVNPLRWQNMTQNAGNE